MSGESFGILVEVNRDRDAAVGAKMLLGRANFEGRPVEGLTELYCASEAKAIPLDTSPNSDCRIRFAGLVFSSLSEVGLVMQTDLNGLALACRMKGGAGFPGVPLPAVRGRSGSSRPALDPLLFKDCCVG